MSRILRNSVVVFLAIFALAVSGSAVLAQDVVSEDQVSVDKVLAVVGDREITVGDVDTVLTTLSPQQQVMFSTDYGRDKILQELINKELIYLWAENNNIDETEAFQNDLENMKRSLMTTHAVREILKDVTVTEEDVAEYFDSHSEEFTDPAQIKASHILVESEDQAIEILAELEGEKLTFEEAAKEYSKGPSAEKGGALGFFSKGQMVPEFENAAFELETGEFSEPVKTQYGWHIITVKDKKPAKQKTLEESRGQIYENLMKEKQFNVYNTTLEDLRANYDIEIMVDEEEVSADQKADEGKQEKESN